MAFYFNVRGRAVSLTKDLDCESIIEMVMVFISTGRLMKAINLLCCLSLVVATAAADVSAKSYDVGTEESANFEEAKPTYNPSPSIPSHHQENCFKSCCIARFFIKSDGSTKVRLVSSSGSNEIDDITLSTLRRWKFKPAMLDGKPVDSTRRIRVEFEVN